jgi:protein-L-isoaspartate(D-aspartate) O-methyltransferase
MALEQTEGSPPCQSFQELFAKAKLKIPRGAFISPGNIDYWRIVWGDFGALKITEDTFSSVSQTQLVGDMLEYAGVVPGARVLEVGTGSGYSAAITQEIVGEKGSVVTIERDEELALKAQRRLERLGYTRIRVIHGDGLKGHPEGAPYDAVIVTAACFNIPRELTSQLTEQGRLVIPITYDVEDSKYIDAIDQSVLMTVSKDGKDLDPGETRGVTFVPIVSDSQGGWSLERVKEWKSANFPPGYSYIEPDDEPPPDFPRGRFIFKTSL